MILFGISTYYQRLKTVEVLEIWLKTIATWIFGIRLSLETAQKNDDMRTTTSGWWCRI